MEDDEISALVKRLARPHRSGGVVVERAAILAAGSDCAAVVDWIIAHAGEPEVTAPPAAAHGLHGRPLSERATSSPPARFILPATALAAPCA